MKGLVGTFNVKETRVESAEPFHIPMLEPMTTHRNQMRRIPTIFDHDRVCHGQYGDAVVFDAVDEPQLPQGRHRELASGGVIRRRHERRQRRCRRPLRQGGG